MNDEYTTFLHCIMVSNGIGRVDYNELCANGLSMDMIQECLQKLVDDNVAYKPIENSYTPASPQPTYPKSPSSTSTPHPDYRRVVYIFKVNEKNLNAQLSLYPQITHTKREDERSLEEVLTQLEKWPKSLLDKLYYLVSVIEETSNKNKNQFSILIKREHRHLAPAEMVMLLDFMKTEIHAIAHFERKSIPHTEKKGSTSSVDQTTTNHEHRTLTLFDLTPTTKQKPLKMMEVHIHPRNLAAFTELKQRLEQLLQSQQESSRTSPISESEAEIRPSNAAAHEIEFIVEQSLLVFGESKCQLPRDEHEHCFCKSMFKRPTGESVYNDILYEEMLGMEPPKETRTVYDTCNRVNKRIRKDLGVGNLFTCKGKFCIRNQ